MSESSLANSFSRLLKFWRGVRALSQEALAHKTGSSARHISRLENGKVHPSHTMVQSLAQVLALGERDSCHLLLAAGYLPLGKAADFRAPEFKWLRKAMGLTLKAMNSPAALMDRYGELLMVNRSWLAFYSQSLAAAQLQQVTNHYELLFNHPRSAPASAEWRNTLAIILMSLTQEALLNNAVDLPLLARLAAHADVPTHWPQLAAQAEPMASFRVQLEVNGKLRHFFSVNQVVGAMGPAAYVSEPRLVINSFYAEDGESVPLGDSLLTHRLLVD